MEKQISVGAVSRAAEINVSSFNEADNTIEVVFTTGAKVRRYSWSEGSYDEELVVSDKSVRLGRLNAGAPFLNTHADYRLEHVIGSVVPGSARISGGKGYARVQLSKRDDIRGIVQDIRDGVLRNISVGYRYHKVEKTDGQEGDAALWRVVDWEPMEISAVPIPADPGAQVRSDPSREEQRYICTLTIDDKAGEERQAEKGDNSMSQKPADEKANPNPEKTEVTTETRVADPAPVAAPAPVIVDAAKVAREAVAADRVRAAEIRQTAVALKLDEDFYQRAIDEGMSADEFRKTAIEKVAKAEPEVDNKADKDGKDGKRSIPAAPEMGRREQTLAARRSAVEAALLHRSSPTDFEFKDEKLAADAREFRGLTLLDLARESLQAYGVDTRGLSRNELASTALSIGGNVRMGGLHTTSDFPIILANVANKVLRKAYEAAPQTFRPFTREVSAPDFKPLQRAQLGEAPQFEKVNEHGEFKRGSLGEASESYSVLTYGKIIGMTRQLIVNDDMDALSRIPRNFGVQAANLESDLVWAAILSNPVMGDGTALFAAGHNNNGTAAGISADSMALAMQAMRLQRGMDGKTFLNIMPRYLLTSVANVMKAEQLLTATTPAMVVTAAANIVPEYLRRITPISEPRLDGAFVNPATGATVAANQYYWYLVADPAQIDTVELAYLEGNRGVYTETRQGFDIDGVEIKVRLDAGAKVIDWRAFYRNPATAL